MAWIETLNGGAVAGFVSGCYWIALVNRICCTKFIFVFSGEWLSSSCSASFPDHGAANDISCAGTSLRRQKDAIRHSKVDHWQILLLPGN